MFGRLRVLWEGDGGLGRQQVFDLPDQAINIDGPEPVEGVSAAGVLTAGTVSSGTSIT